MASESIITMVPATQALAADLFPISQAGANLSQNRQIFLTAISGESVALAGPSSAFGISNADWIEVFIGNARRMHAHCDATLCLSIESGGGSLLQAPNAGVAQLAGDANNAFSATGNNGIAVPGVAMDCDASGTIQARKNGFVILSVGTTGNVSIATDTGDLFSLACNGGGFNIDASGISTFPKQCSYTTGIDSLHVGGNGHTPTISAGTGAGTLPSVSLTGTDTNGQITLSTGTGPAANGIVLTVTFFAAFASAPNVVFSPMNANTAQLSTRAVYVTTTTTTFVLTANTTALVASTLYKWSYHVLGK